MKFLDTVLSKDEVSEIVGGLRLKRGRKRIYALDKYEKNLETPLSAMYELYMENGRIYFNIIYYHTAWFDWLYEELETLKSWTYYVPKSVKGIPTDLVLCLESDKNDRRAIEDMLNKYSDFLKTCNKHFNKWKNYEY